MVDCKCCDEPMTKPEERLRRICDKCDQQIDALAGNIKKIDPFARKAAVRREKVRIA